MINFIHAMKISGVSTHHYSSEAHRMKVVEHELLEGRVVVREMVKVELVTSHFTVVVCQQTGQRFIVHQI